MRRVLVSFLAALALMAWGTAHASNGIWGAISDAGCDGTDTNDVTSCIGHAGSYAAAHGLQLDLQGGTFKIATSGGVNATGATNAASSCTWSPYTCGEGGWNGINVVGHGGSNFDCANANICLDGTGNTAWNFDGFGFIRNQGTKSQVAIKIGRESSCNETGLHHFTHVPIGFYGTDTNWGIIDNKSEQDSYYDAWVEANTPMWVAGHDGGSTTYPPVRTVDDSNGDCALNGTGTHFQTILHNMTLMAHNGYSLETHGALMGFNLDNTFLAANGTSPTQYAVYHNPSGSDLWESDWTGEVEHHSGLLYDESGNLSRDKFKMNMADNVSCTYSQLSSCQPIFDLTGATAWGNLFDVNPSVCNTLVMFPTNGSFYGNDFDLSCELLTTNATGETFNYGYITANTSGALLSGNAVRGDYFAINAGGL